ncbi:hypothetical protein [uncultured Martelella sp.]|uniref:hypothetical protein n=1 Tax=uncultured Martelella sp. TaxID=392331 RepID=UPI0029C84557|nr:hypothetical protein [uncultured Martelella sp.]
MTCKCIEIFDEGLAERNTRIAPMLLFHAIDGVRPHIRTEQIETGRGKKKACSVIPTYCPFCGMKYRDSDAPTEPEWQWWYGKDTERMAGSAPTREDAIAAGRGEYGEEEFVILEAAKAHPRLPDADDILGVLTEKNEDLGDQEGDGFGHDLGGTQEQRDELTTRLQDTLSDWLTHHKAWPHVWTFSCWRNEEVIPATDDVDQEGGA